MHYPPGLSFDWQNNRWVLCIHGRTLIFPGPDGPSLLTECGVLYVNGRPWWEWETCNG